MGFDEDVVPRSALFTSLDACVQLCKNSGHRPLLMLNPSAQSAFPDSDSFKPDASTSPKDLSAAQWEELKRCDSVLIGLAPDLMRHEWLDEAFRLLSGEYGEKAQLIGTHRAMYLRPGGSTSDGKARPLSLGPGAFLSGLEAASGIDPGDTIVVGKPQPAFFAECLKGMGWSSNDSNSEVWIVSHVVPISLFKNGEHMLNTSWYVAPACTGRGRCRPRSVHPHQCRTRHRPSVRRHDQTRFGSDRKVSSRRRE